MSYSQAAWGFRRLRCWTSCPEKKSTKKITTIQQWVVCFNSFVSVMAKRHPERVHELLAYSAVIAKASQDYDGLPWLAYDSHFRRVVAASGTWDWSQINPSLWTLYFLSARLSMDTAGGLAITPVQQEGPKPAFPPAEKSGRQPQRAAAHTPEGIPSALGGTNGDATTQAAITAIFAWNATPLTIVVESAA